MVEFNGGTYLFFDTNVPECLEAASFLSEKRIAFTEVPSSGLIEARLAVGIHTFIGLDAIRRAVEKHKKVAV